MFFVNKVDADADNQVGSIVALAYHLPESAGLMLIYLLRHAEAVDASEVGGDDAARTLTIEGQDNIRRVGVALNRMRVEPEAVWSSPYPRALESAMIVAQELNVSGKVEVIYELRAGGSSPEGLIELMQARSGIGPLMLVGHNPDLEQLGNFLLGSQGGVTLKKGGLALIRAEKPFRRGCGKLMKLWTPKFLAKFAQ